MIISSWVSQGNSSFAVLLRISTLRRRGVRARTINMGWTSKRRGRDMPVYYIITKPTYRRQARHTDSNTFTRTAIPTRQSRNTRSGVFHSDRSKLNLSHIIRSLRASATRTQYKSSFLFPERLRNQTSEDIHTIRTRVNAPLNGSTKGAIRPRK